MPIPELPEEPTLGLPCAFGGPVLDGVLRQVPEDFVVVEELGYEASGHGEHVMLRVRKRGRNTAEVARLLARHAGVAQVAVGFAGLKDRNADTTQHFSVQLAGREAPDWSLLEDDSLQVLSAVPHHRKVRRGSLRGNRFEIRVTAVRGDTAQAEDILQRIAREGVPNYFGNQRFGHRGGNLQRFSDMIGRRGRRPGREQRSLLLSAARSHLFNQVLAARLADGSWQCAVEGDVLQLEGSQRQFMHDPADPSIATRLADLDIHPSGPLCGRSGRALQPVQLAAQREHDVLGPWADWIDALARMGVDADRRALRLVVSELTWTWQEDALVLTFGLPAGGYATTVLRELLRSAG